MVAEPAAILFPGQGAQKPGMGKDFYDACQASRAVYERAETILGYDLAAICFDGPAETLNDTAVCQPAILATSLAALAAVEERGLVDRAEMAAAAGLSLGEYTALIYAGALTEEDGIRLVARRGELMAAAARERGGTMCSIIGLKRPEVEEAIGEAAEAGKVCAANFNCPGQIVISGEAEAVRRAAELCKSKGARMAVPLAVSGAFHSPLMASAAERFRDALSTVEFQSPRTPVISNVTGRDVGGAGEIAGLLERQLTHSVLWEDSMRRILGRGVKIFYEVGPGTVLAGLMRRIDREARVINIHSVAALDALGST